MRFDSKAEAEFARGLDLRMHARDPKERVESWEPHVRYPIVVNGVKICDYEIDFVIRYADGRKELVEVKGFWTRDAALKVKLFRATFLLDHPDIIYTIAK